MAWQIHRSPMKLWNWTPACTLTRAWNIYPFMLLSVMLTSINVQYINTSVKHFHNWHTLVSIGNIMILLSLPRAPISPVILLDLILPQNGPHEWSPCDNTPFSIALLRLVLGPQGFCRVLVQNKWIKTDFHYQLVGHVLGNLLLDLALKNTLHFL